MSKFAVDYSQLNMAGQLLERQQQHTESLKNYLDSYCRLESSAFGWLLQMLHPINEMVVDCGKNGATLLGDVSAWAARNTRSSLTAYLEADRAAYEAAAALAAQLGVSPPPFPVSASDLPKLGGAATRADAGYGTSMSAYQVDLDHIVSGAQTGGDAVSLVTGTVSTGLDRLGSLTNRGGVIERSDPSSYLVTPQTPPENFVEDLRWNSGLILGSIDWVVERFIGYSVLEECVYKPFGGDWHAIGRASGAWSHGGQSLMELGSNFSGLPGQAEGWRGDAAEAFQAALALMSAAAVALSYAFDAVSGLVGIVESAAKIACSAIASAIGLIETIVLLILPQLTIPIAGWITATATAMTQIKRVIMAVKVINMAINALMDAINEFIAAREKIVQAVFMAEDLANSAITRAVRA